MVDGSHFDVTPKESENPESFRNRHHKKSINAMLVTLPSGKIIYVKGRTISKPVSIFAATLLSSYLPKLFFPTLTFLNKFKFRKMI